ncbi:hypothetical protein ACE198_04985 [Neobacillus sp. KR4-4]
MDDEEIEIDWDIENEVFHLVFGEGGLKEQKQNGGVYVLCSSI